MKFSTFIILSVILFMTAIIGCDDATDPITPQIGSRTLFVANSNQNSGTISTIDLESGTVNRDVIGVGIVPNDVIWNDGKAWVINSTSYTINVLTLDENDQLIQDGDPINIGGDGRFPQYGVIHNGNMYITNSITEDVLVLDLASRTVTDTIKVGKSPADLCVSSGKLYVCNSGFNSDDFSYDDPVIVYVISLENNVVTDSILVGVNPQYITEDRNGLLHIVCTGNYFDVMGSVYVVNASRNQVVHFIELGGSPGEVAISTDGYAYVAAGGWVDAGYIFRYNAYTYEVLNGPDNPIEVGTGAMRVVAGDNREVYVACMNGDRVDMVVADLSVANWIVGDGPGAMVFIPDLVE